MKAFMQKYLNGILLTLGELLVGILLLIKPVGFSTGILIAVGIAMAVMGVTRIKRYLSLKTEDAVHSHDLSAGLLLLLLGFFTIVKTEWIVNMFPALTSLYGILMLASGLFKVEMTVNMLRLKRGNVLWMGISTAVTLIVAVVILMNPFTAVSTLWIFIGAALLVEAVLDVLTMVLKTIQPKT